MFLALAAAPLCAQESSLDEALQTGRELFDKGQYDQAAQRFQKVRAAAPRAWQGHAYLAMTLVQKASHTKDPLLKEQHLTAAARAAGFLVKSDGAGLRFTDPLYRFIDSVIKGVRGDTVKSQAILQSLIGLPEDRFRPYATVPLRPNVEQAYAQASLQILTRLIFVGAFDDADTLLERVQPYVMPTGTMRLNFERQSAVVDEHLGRLEDAVQHLRNCVPLMKDDIPRQHDLRATIAMMLMQNKRLEEGRKILAELPADSKSPEVVAARCMSHYLGGRKDPRGPAADAAIAYYRSALPTYPVELAYLMVEQFADLVLARVDRRTAADERPLLEFAVSLARKQLEIRPECPHLYYGLYRLYRLLGDEKMEIRYQDLHKERKAAWGSKKQYDENGRPRCR